MLQKQILSCLLALIVSATTLAQDAEPQKTVFENGKLFVIDGDGNKTEVDISDARSFTIQQSNRMIDQNGDQVRESNGQAVIIGPDGKKTVIELEGDGQFEIPGLRVFARGLNDGNRIGNFAFQADGLGPGFRGAGGPNVFKFDRANIGKFMIGVHCSPVDDGLRSHLRLDNGVGLIIKSINPGTPAEEADLQVHDILLFADDQELGTTQDLSSAVEIAGEEGRGLAITFLREGEEETGELVPVERPESDNAVIDFAFPGNMEKMQFQQLGPGIILDADTKFDEAFQDIRRQMKQMREDMREEMKQMMERDR